MWKIQVDPRSRVESNFRMNGEYKVVMGDREIDKKRSWNNLQIGDNAEIEITALPRESEANNINIFIHPFGEARFPEATLNISPNCTIQQLKEKISSICGIPSEKQRLLFNRATLETGTINECGIEEMSEVILFKS